MNIKVEADETLYVALPPDVLKSLSNGVDVYLVHIPVMQKAADPHDLSSLPKMQEGKQAHLTEQQPGVAWHFDEAGEWLFDSNAPQEILDQFEFRKGIMQDQKSA